MPKRLITGFIVLLVLGGIFSVPTLSRADDSLLIAPAVLDRKAKARDILNETIVVANTTDHALHLYPVVDNVAAADGTRSFDDPSKTDLSTSLANWIFFTRGLIELQPGERRTLDLRIEVNLNAKPGMYHALISFPAGNTRPEAEAAARNAPSLAVNLEVLDDAKEILQLNNFNADASFFFRSPAAFSYTLENIGNRPLAPEGSIIIYDGGGREIGTGALNPEGAILGPGDKKTFSNIWRPDVFRFGRYKAYLDLHYGNTTARLQDTAFFWMVPWYVLLILLIFLTALGFFVANLVHRRYALWHHTRVRAIAARSEDLARRLAAVPPPMPPSTTLRPATRFISREFRAVPAVQKAPLPPVQRAVVTAPPPRPPQANLVAAPAPRPPRSQPPAPPARARRLTVEAGPAETPIRVIDIEHYLA